MTRLRAAAAAFVLLALAPTVVPADDRQEPARAEVEAVSRRAGELLSSYDARDRAWGAYLAGKFGLAEYVPAISAALDASAAAEPRSDGSFVRQVALDALIRLDADVDPNLLMKVFRSNDDEVAVLLCRNRSAEASRRAMLALLEESDEPVWTAFCDSLAVEKVRGFAARLLSDLTVTLAVTVSDDGREASDSWGPSSAGDGVLPIPSGFPPITIYKLSLSPGGFVVADRPRTVYCYTSTSEGGRNLFVGSNSGLIDYEEHRVACLATMLDAEPEETKLRATVLASVAWKGVDAYKAEVGELFAKIDADVARTKARLREAGLLTEAEAATATPKVSLWVSDKRRVRSPRLPKFRAEAEE